MERGWAQSRKIGWADGCMAGIITRNSPSRVPSGGSLPSRSWGHSRRTGNIGPMTGTCTTRQAAELQHDREALHLRPRPSGRLLPPWCPDHQQRDSARTSSSESGAAAPPVGIAIQELMEYFNIPTDHISLRTSFYEGVAQTRQRVRVHGLGYLVRNLNAHNALLIVDDVYDSGRSIKAVVDQLTRPHASQHAAADQGGDALVQAREQRHRPGAGLLSPRNRPGGWCSPMRSPG